MKITMKGIPVICSLLAVCITFSMALGACKKSKPAQPSPPVVVTPSDSAKRILFVGNSLTYFNNLPGVVVRIGKSKGVEIDAQMLALPNYALEDHWNDGHLQNLIATKKYHFVVVQQGPSSQMDGRIMLLDYGARIKNICAPHNTKLAFFMVWPAFSNFHTFDGVIANYTEAATATNSLLCPVGKLWKAYFLATNDYSYYGPDMFHPSKEGTENAAQIIYETLFR